MTQKQIQCFYRFVILFVIIILEAKVIHMGYTDSLSSLQTQMKEILKETITVDIKNRSNILTGEMTFGFSKKTALSSDSTTLLCKEKSIKYAKDTTLSLIERKNLAILRILSLENPINIDSLNSIFSQKAKLIGIKGIFNFTIIKEQGDTLQNTNNYTDLIFVHTDEIKMISEEKNHIILSALYDPFYISSQIKITYWIIAIILLLLLGSISIKIEPKLLKNKPINPDIIIQQGTDTEGESILSYKDTHTFDLSKRKFYRNNSPLLSAITLSKGCHTRAIEALLKEESYALPKEIFLQTVWGKPAEKITEQTLSTMLSRLNTSIEKLDIRLIKEGEIIKFEELNKR